MIPYPEIDPVIVRIGPLALRWYGLMYLLGFASSYLLVRKKLNPERNVLPDERIEDLYFMLILGLVVGARVGYMIFYGFDQLLSSPLKLFAVWEGGMSFHGGLIGAVATGLWFCRRYRIKPLPLADILAVTAPIGLGFGRLGNFINGELWGRTTDVPWGMVFPGGGEIPRHPSQLYELFLEGFLLFIILWISRKQLRKPGQMIGLFLLLYGCFRIVVEFFREPDPQLGFLFGLVTMGQLLSSIMVAAGIFLIIRTSRKEGGT